VTSKTGGLPSLVTSIWTSDCTPSALRQRGLVTCVMSSVKPPNPGRKG